jgi:hypothetical protein
MKRKAVGKSFVSAVLLLAFLAVLPAARADETNQETKVTFSQAVQISGHVLPAGTYLFVLPNDINQHQVVRIFSSDGIKLYATILTANVERSQPTDNTAFTLAERGSALPEAIVTWFYPGRTIGHEFLYPKQVQKELGKDQQTTIVAGS